MSNRYRQPWEQEMDRGVDEATIHGIMEDNRKSRAPSSVIPQKAQVNAGAASGAQAKGTNGWLPEKPFTHEPSYAERRLAEALPAQGKGGL
jgi:hypothetical protein